MAREYQILHLNADPTRTIHAVMLEQDMPLVWGSIDTRSNLMVIKDHDELIKVKVLILGNFFAISTIK